MDRRGPRAVQETVTAMWEWLRVRYQDDPGSWHPDLLLAHPGGISETEVLFPYGSTSFASKAGPLAGNHFATIDEGHELLPELGRRVLYEGAQEIVFSEA